MTRRWLPRLTLALALTAPLLAQSAATVDEARAAWQYRREVTVPAGGAGVFAAIPLPPDVAARSLRGLRDVRLVDAAGRETPFLVLEDTERTSAQVTTGRLVEARQQRRDGSAWTVDFAQPITFDRLVLDVPGRDFSKRLRLELSLDGTTWQETAVEAWVFDRTWEGQVVHGTTLETPRATARFARLTADDIRSRPIQVTGARAEAITRLPGSRWTQDVPLELVATSGGHSRYRVAVPAGFPVRRLAIDGDDPAFARPVAVLEQRAGLEVEVGRQMAYRFRLPDAPTDVEDRDVEVTGTTGGALVVDVEDGDNPPLVNARARLSAPQTLLVTATRESTLTLYYGNAVTRAAVYDLERLRGSLSAVAAFPTATLGDEAANPRFRTPAPLAFVPARGAVVNPGDWKYSRSLRVDGADDLYTFTVPAADLARGRRDFGDLRVVDAANQQVPYVLETQTDTVRIPLTVAPTAPRQGVTRASAFTLSLPDGSYPDPVPLTTLDLQVAEGFFTRDATVLVAQPEAPQGQRVVASRTLTSAQRDLPAAPVTVAIALGDVSASSVMLELHDGDNAPLTIRGAFAVAAVPRLTFKASAGDYRLLFGNERVPAPSYELQALRQDVLAYSALPLGADALQPAVANPAYTPRVSDVMRAAPPAALLWGALGIAVVVLLALTRRILKSGPPDARA